jgi:prevent-host-death family protein
MPRVGVRELKNRASEILRAVREEGAEYIITYQGRPSAVLLPIDIDEEDLEDYILAHHPHFVELREQARQAIRRSEFATPQEPYLSTPSQVAPKVLDAQTVAQQIAHLVASIPSLEAVYVWTRSWGFECWLVANQSTEGERFRLYDVEWILMERFPGPGFKFNLVDREGRPLSKVMSVAGFDAAVQLGGSTNA